MYDTRIHCLNFQKIILCTLSYFTTTIHVFAILHYFTTERSFITLQFDPADTRMVWDRTWAVASPLTRVMRDEGKEGNRESERNSGRQQWFG